MCENLRLTMTWICQIGEEKVRMKIHITCHSTHTRFTFSSSYHSSTLNVFYLTLWWDQKHRVGIIMELLLTWCDSFDAFEMENWWKVGNYERSWAHSSFEGWQRRWTALKTRHAVWQRSPQKRKDLRYTTLYRYCRHTAHTLGECEERPKEMSSNL